MRLTLIHANKRVPWWYSGNRLSLLQDVFVYFKISVIWTFLKIEFCFTILYLTHNIQSEVIERWAKESLSVRIPELTMCHVNTLWIHNHGGFGMTTLVTDAQDTIVHLRLDLEIGGFPAQKKRFGNRWPPHRWTNITKVEASKHVLTLFGKLLILPFLLLNINLIILNNLKLNNRKWDSTILQLTPLLSTF